MRPHWDGKADAWADHLPRSELFAELLEAILASARPEPDDTALDLGAGTGFVTSALAERVDRVYAVDVSAAMLVRLSNSLAESGHNVVLAAADLRQFSPPEAIDLVVSNYALHHLTNGQKRRLLRSAHGWLKPGGRIVISDMMVRLTLLPGQSAPLVRKVVSISRKGPSGYWRIVKNAGRWAMRRGEYPADLDFWIRELTAAGFDEVEGRSFGVDSGVVGGRRPAVNPADEANHRCGLVHAPSEVLDLPGRNAFDAEYLDESTRPGPP